MLLERHAQFNKIILKPYSITNGTFFSWSLP